MGETRIRRTVVSPDGREKVELFGSHQGASGFRLWQRKRKRWRQAGEVLYLMSYARAVYEAGQQVDWLRRALPPLELLRGYSFRFSAFTEEVYCEHDHCCACWKKFADRDADDVQRQGFVTRYSIPDGSGSTQWNWICENCFLQLRESMQWSVEQ